MGFSFLFYTADPCVKALVFGFRFSVFGFRFSVFGFFSVSVFYFIELPQNYIFCDASWRSTQGEANKRSQLVMINDGFS